MARSVRILAGLCLSDQTFARTFRGLQMGPYLKLSNGFVDELFKHDASEGAPATQTRAAEIAHYLHRLLPWDERSRTSGESYLFTGRFSKYWSLGDFLNEYAGGLLWPSEGSLYWG